MDELILRRITETADVPELLEVLSERLSSADLNTILLAVFQQKAAQLTPAALMRQYQRNRFVQPASVDTIDFSDFSLDWLKASKVAGFEPLELSPVCPLGTCSVVATAHQNKIISALRGTEVVADATNVLALESISRRKPAGFPAQAMCFSTLHRHVRAQGIPDIPGFSAHFTILGLSSAGRDLGDFNFEKENLRQHLHFFSHYFTTALNIAPVKIRLLNLSTSDKENRLFNAVKAFLRKSEPTWPIEIIESNQVEQSYYHRLQFKIVIPNPKGGELEIADGGFTDWTQQLSGNQKERMLISGIGLELLFKLMHGLV